MRQKPMSICKFGQRWSGAAARVLAAGALAFTMGGGACLASGIQSAHADDTPGYVRIELSEKAEDKVGTSQKSNHDVKYNAYKIFSGNVGQETAHNGRAYTDQYAENRISDINWANESMHAIAMKVIEDWIADHGAEDTRTSAFTDPLGGSSSWSSDANLQKASAQLAAEFIANHMGAGTGDYDKGNPNQEFTLRLEAKQFGSLLSGALKQGAYDGGYDVGGKKRAVSPEPGATVGGESRTALSPATSYAFSDGWYLIVTAPGSLADDGSESSAGTSPVYVVLGDNRYTASKPLAITEKGSVVTVDKLVMDDSSDVWHQAADANAEQDTAYMVIGTVPDNIHSFDSFYYKFTDTAENSLRFDGASCKAGTAQWTTSGTDSERTVEDGSTVKEKGPRVYLHKLSDAESTKTYGDGFHRYDVSSNFTVNVANSADGGKNVLTAECANLRSLVVNGTGRPYDMSAGDFLTLEYEAHLESGEDVKTYVSKGELAAKMAELAETQGSDASINVREGDRGNENEVYITYSDDPKRSSTQDTLGENTKLYTYSLRLHKQDKQNAGRALSGAKFTLRVESGDDGASEGKFVQADGSLGDGAHEFVTDGGGNIVVKNLDAGTYLLHETVAPPTGPDGNTDNPADAYEKVDDVHITIGSNVHDDTMVGGEKAYESGSIWNREADSQVLEMSAGVINSGFGFGHTSEAVLADAVAENGLRADDEGNTVETGGVHPVANALADFASGKAGADGNVSVVVRETKETQMPLTGGAGVGLAAASTALVGAGAALLRRRERSSLSNVGGSK